MKKGEIKRGDILKNQWGDYRIVTLVLDGVCHYVEYRDDDSSLPQGYFFNPCRAAVGEDALRKYSRVGTLTPSVLVSIRNDLSKIMAMHNDAFIRTEALLNGNEDYDIKNFIHQ